MLDRTQIKTVLPKIDVEVTNSLPTEMFQSKTLRPILKFQNELILQLFYSFLQEFKIDFDSFSNNKKTLKINELLKENQQVKQFYLGTIVALFTNEEFEFYASNKKEINKRIISLLIERIGSQVV
jgi:hypothetical protein